MEKRWKRQETCSIKESKNWKKEGNDRQLVESKKESSGEEREKPGKLVKSQKERKKEVEKRGKKTTGKLV